MLVFEAEHIVHTMDLHDAKVTVKQVKVSNFTTVDIELDKKGKIWPSLHNGVSEDMSIGIDADSLAVNNVVWGAYSGYWKADEWKVEKTKLAFSASGFEWYDKG